MKNIKRLPENFDKSGKVYRAMEVGNLYFGLVNFAVWVDCKLPDEDLPLLIHSLESDQGDEAIQEFFAAAVRLIEHYRLER